MLSISLKGAGMSPTKTLLDVFGAIEKEDSERLAFGRVTGQEKPPFLMTGVTATNAESPPFAKLKSFTTFSDLFALAKSKTR